MVQSRDILKEMGVNTIKKVRKKKSIKKYRSNIKIPSILISKLDNFQKISIQMAGIQEVLGRRLGMVKKIFNQINIANLFASNISIPKNLIFPQMESIFKISNYREQIMKELEEEKEICKEEKFKEFPFLCAEYLTIPEMRNLKKKWKQGNKNEVVELIKSTLRVKGIHESILESIDNESPLKKRKKLFEQALESHRKGNYILSIPLLFPIIEGTLIDKYGHLFKETQCPTCKMKRRATANPVLTKIKKELKESKKSIFLIQYIAQIEHLIENFSSNRNPILHGSKVDYEDEKLSAVLILSAISLNFDDGLSL